jgi:hypothetical protein
VQCFLSARAFTLVAFLQVSSRLPLEVSLVLPASSVDVASARTLQVTINGVMCSTASFVGQNEIKVQPLSASPDLGTMLQHAPAPSFSGG